MGNTGQFAIVIYLLQFIFTAHVPGQELQTDTACYGNTFNTFLEAHCGANEAIAVANVYAMAKLKSTGCKDEVTPTEEPTTPASCCTLEQEDCGVRYTKTALSQYTQCTGKSSCQSVGVSWVATDVDTTCDNTLYKDRTSYMHMEYYCIPRDSIKSPCDDSTTSSSSVYLWNSGYPSVMSVGADACSCSVEVSCDTSVQMTVFDLRLAADNNQCTQSLKLLDNGAESIVDCSANNEFNMRPIWSNSDHFIQVTLDNSHSSAEGNFWVKFSGLNPNSNITLSCGSAFRSTPQFTSLPDCPVLTSTTVETTSKGSSDQNKTSVTTPMSEGSSSKNFISSPLTTSSSVYTSSSTTTSSQNVSSSTLGSTRAYSSSILTQDPDTNKTTHASRAYSSSLITQDHDTNKTTPASTTLNPNLSSSQSTYGNDTSSNISPSAAVSTPAVTPSNVTTTDDGLEESGDGDGQSGSGDGVEHSGSGDGDGQYGGGNGGDNTAGRGSSGGGGSENGESGKSSEASDGGSGMVAVIGAIAAVLVLFVVLGIVIWCNRNRLRQKFCPKKEKVSLDAEKPEVDANANEFDPYKDNPLFSTTYQPIISMAAKSTSHPSFLQGETFLGKRQELQPLERENGQTKETLEKKSKKKKKRRKKKKKQLLERINKVQDTDNLAASLRKSIKLGESLMNRNTSLPKLE